MRYFLLFISLISVFISCSKSHHKRTFHNIFIEKIPVKNTSIRALVAIDSSSLYYAGSNGVIGFTKNGGKVWTQKQLQFQDSIIPHFRSIAKSGENIFALSIANPALLYKINETDTLLVYQETHEKVFYDCLQFFKDDKRGIAVGDPTERCPSIIMTANAGNTWSKISCDQLPTFEEGEAFFAASNTNIKIINNTIWIASGGKKARILKSIDGGENWRSYDTPIIQGEGSEGIYSIDFADEKNGIIIGGSYNQPKRNAKNKAITTDGGETWQIIADNLNPSYKSCIQYIPNTSGKEIIAVGKTGISFSNDGGITWNDVSDDDFYAIQFVNKNFAWLAGNNKIGKLRLKKP